MRGRLLAHGMGPSVTNPLPIGARATTARLHFWYMRGHGVSHCSDPDLCIIRRQTVTYHRDPAAARDAGITYHLVPAPVWEAGKAAAWYTPEAYDADGFIHCTNGIDQLVEVANMFYVDDPRAFRVLILDAGSIASDLRYDDEGQLFPHIYGPLNTSAVIGELTVTRAADGTFLSIDE